MTVLTAPLQPYATIGRHTVGPISDPVVSRNIVLARLEEMFCRFQHALVGIAYIACRRYDQVEGGFRRADLSVHCVSDLEADGPICSLLVTDDFPSGHDLAPPFGLIGLMETLVIHGFIEAIQQFWSDHAIVRGSISLQSFLLRFRRQRIEVIDSVRVEDFVDAARFVGGWRKE